MEIIAQDAYEQRWQEGIVSTVEIADAHGFDRMATSEHHWSSEHNCRVELPGLYLEMCDEQFHHDLNVQAIHDDFQVLAFRFYLSGHHTVISPSGIANVPIDYAEIGGNSYLFYLPELEEIEQHHAGDFLSKVTIDVDLDFIRTFTADWDSIPPSIRPAIESDVAPQFHRLAGKLTPAMRIAIQQMRQMPYQGTIARMYLESKALELVVLQLAQLTEAERGKQSGLKLKPNDIERIYQAKALLDRDYCDPLSLLDLAKQVGVNDCKLKQGFRQLFGTTVFGYLHHQRMEQARELLQDDKLNVGAVANAVGYATQGRFAAAFKRKFGTTPSECRRGKRSTLPNSPF